MIVVGITGASGAIYAKLLLNELCSLIPCQQISVVFSEKAKDVWAHEIGSFTHDYPFAIYENDDFNATFASGSSQCSAMIICPCSMGTMSRIANGMSDTLITRAADVMLKERRKLILATRETPINLIHINNMQILTHAGAIIAPASPSFYSKPKTVEDTAMTVVDRLLQLAGIKKEVYIWGV